MGPLGYETLLVHGDVRRERGRARRASPSAIRAGARAIGVLRPELRPWDDIRALLRLARTVRAVAARHRPHPHGEGGHARPPRRAGRPPAPARGAHLPRPRARGLLPAPGRSGVYRTLERALARVSDRLIGVSETTVDDLVRLGIAPRERFRCVPPRARARGVRAQPATPRAAGAQGRAAGRRRPARRHDRPPRPIKRLDLALRAIAEARARGARARLVVVGDGPAARARSSARRASSGSPVPSRFLGAPRRHRRDRGRRRRCCCSARRTRARPCR